MIQKSKHFLQYNNAAMLLFVIALLVGGSVFAAPLGQEVLGKAQTRIEGVDNTLLLSADLAEYDMKFKIETIQEDSGYYYITYTYKSLFNVDGAWKEEMKEVSRKITKKLDQDLGEYMASQLKDEYDAKIAELKIEQDKAKQVGEERQVQVTEYSGLIGKVLNVSKEVFPGYEPVEKIELPTPESVTPVTGNDNVADNLAEVYNDYLQENPQVADLVNSNEQASTTPTMDTSSTTIGINSEATATASSTVVD